MTRDEAKKLLEPGTRVLVARKTHPCREGWVAGAMDSMIGKELAVLRVSPDSGAVRLEDGYWYPPESLEFAEFGNEEDD